jgi:hypothetical protein
LRLDSRHGGIPVVVLTNPAPSEKISHGELTFFTPKHAFVMFANNHHGDRGENQIAVSGTWIEDPVIGGRQIASGASHYLPPDTSTMVPVT